MANSKKPNIYLLTNNGSGYNLEGTRYLQKRFEREHNLTEFNLIEGAQNNDPKYLATKLRQRPDSGVVVSTSDMIYIAFDETSMLETAQALDDNPDNTSWETITRIIKESTQEKQS